MAELVQVKNETPLAKLALQESSVIIEATLDRFRAAGQQPDLTRLLMTIATSCYLSGVNSGVHMALRDAKLAESLVRQNTSDEDFALAQVAAIRFLAENKAGQDEPTGAADHASAGAGASGLR